MNYQREFQACYKPHEDWAEFLRACLILAIRLTGCREAWVVPAAQRGELGRWGVKMSRARLGLGIRLNGDSTTRLKRVFSLLAREGDAPVSVNGPGGVQVQGGKSGLAVPIRYQNRLKGIILAFWKEAVPERGGSLSLVRLARDLALHAQRYEVSRLVEERLARKVLIVGASPAMREVDLFLEKASNADLHCLITGEVGCGKELAAYSLHFGSPRSDGPFVAVNCAALPRDLAESILFGHVKGSFTGATSNHPGKFEQAQGGTLFLDEVGELEQGVQSMLLRAVQYGEVHTIGAKQRRRRADVRIIAATSRDLEKQVRADRFSQALHSRFFLHLKLPPLRERTGDIPHLAAHFLRSYSPDGSQRRLAPKVVERMQGHAWPANVRGLERMVARLATFSEKRIIDLDDLEAFAPEFENRRGGPEGLSLRDKVRSLVEGYEKSEIEAALERSSWNVTRAAKDLGTSHQNLFKKIKKYQLKRPDIGNGRAHG